VIEMSEKEEAKERIIKQYLLILNKIRQNIGLADWDILIDCENLTDKETYAESTIDIYEKTIVIKLSEKVFEMKSDEQFNVLLHELVHSRIAIFKEEKQKLTDYLEEEFANDLTKIHNIDKYVLITELIDESINYRNLYKGE